MAGTEYVLHVMHVRGEVMVSVVPARFGMRRWLVSARMIGRRLRRGSLR